MIKVKLSGEGAGGGIQEGFTEEVTFHLKPGWQESGCNLKLRGKDFLDKGRSKGQCSRNVPKAPSVLEQGAGGEVVPGRVTF